MGSGRNRTALSRLARVAGWLARQERWLPWAVALVVLSAGAFYALALGTELRFKDERDYLRIAEHLAHAGVYSLDEEHPTAYRPPGYPFLLTLLVKCGGGFPAFRIANFAALAATVVLVHHFFRRRGMALAGVAAALLVGLYPPLFYTAGTLYAQTLAGFLLVSILVLALGDSAPGARRGLVLGAACGYLILTAPLFAANVCLVFAWLALRRLRENGAGVACAVVVSAVVVGAWSVRNYAVFDSFVFVSTNSGRNLLLGNSENATATSGADVDLSGYEARASSLSELEQDRFYRESALRWIAANPGIALKRYALRVLNHFNFRNVYQTPGRGSALEVALLAGSYLPLLALLGWRLLWWRRVPPFPGEGLLVLLYLSTAFVAAIFFTRIRFRLPLDLVLILIAGGFLERLVGRLRPGPSFAARPDQ